MKAKVIKIFKELAKGKRSPFSGLVCLNNFKLEDKELFGSIILNISGKKFFHKGIKKCLHLLLHPSEHDDCIKHGKGFTAGEIKEIELYRKYKESLDISKDI